MKNQLGFTSFELLLAIVYSIGLIGWIWNIIKIVQIGFDVVTGIFIMRCIGVFLAPLGSVLGFI